MSSGRARMIWLRQLQQWHRLSAGVCLAALAVFAITGFTLSRAEGFRATSLGRNTAALLPAPLQVRLSQHGAAGLPLLPTEVSAWLRQQFGVDAARSQVQWSAEAVLVSAPRAGRDTSVLISRASGETRFESSWRGMAAWLRDLQQGRHTGGLWRGFMDLVAVAGAVFAVTSLLRLMMVLFAHRFGMARQGR